jgi:hypothetical protein
MTEMKVIRVPNADDGEGPGARQVLIDGGRIDGDGRAGEKIVRHDVLNDLPVADLGFERTSVTGREPEEGSGEERQRLLESRYHLPTSLGFNRKRRGRQRTDLTTYGAGGEI